MHFFTVLLSIIGEGDEVTFDNDKVCPLCGKTDSTKHAYETCDKLPFHEKLLGTSTNTKLKPFIRKIAIIKLQAIRMIRGEAIKEHNKLIWTDEAKIKHRCMHVMDNKICVDKIMELGDDKCIITTKEKIQIAYDKKKCNMQLHSMKIALKDSVIWDSNFEERIDEKIQTLLKYSGMLKTNNGEYINSKQNPTTSVTALRERGSPEGLANGPSG